MQVGTHGACAGILCRDSPIPEDFGTPNCWVKASSAASFVSSKFAGPSRPWLEPIRALYRYKLSQIYKIPFFLLL
eukprot:COSAG05_NODE_6070_length_1027_cov_1.372845_3_plen_74_part_01